MSATLPDEDLVKARIVYALRTGKPLRPAYSELRTLLYVIGVLLTTILLANIAICYHFWVTLGR
jgi:hypothetical protein